MAALDCRKRGHGVYLLSLYSELALLGCKLEELVTASIHTRAIDVANLALCGIEMSSPCASSNGHVAAAVSQCVAWLLCLAVWLMADEWGEVRRSPVV